MKKYYCFHDEDEDFIALDKDCSNSKYTSISGVSEENEFFIKLKKEDAIKLAKEILLYND